MSLKPEVRDRQCDVLIIGAGMAGACLARQLRLELPELKVINIDAKESFDYWVGESTVEAFDDYARRVLKLGQYLDTNHIVKNGLRFFCDSPQKNLPIEKMSEIGRSTYPVMLRAMQLDRARFDRDMCRMNQELGVEVLTGCRVWQRAASDGEHISLGPEHHTVRTTAGLITCWYLVDAAGRESPLVRKLGLGVDDHEQFGMSSSYWARYDDVRSLDVFGDDAWRRRVNYGNRSTSTNHFLYDGYWIWVISLNEKVHSVGVVLNARQKKLTLKNVDELTTFFREHKALDQLLGDSRPMDFFALKHYCRAASQHFSKDRWYLTGMSGLFIDPLFSTGSVVLAAANRMIVELIKADRGGDARRLERRLRHFNIMQRNAYQAMREPFGDMHKLGCFDAFGAWDTLLYHNYRNWDLPALAADFKPVLDIIDNHDEACGCAVGRWSEGEAVQINGYRLIKEFVAHADRLGRYHDRNEGAFQDTTERPDLRARTYSGVLGAEAHRSSAITWEAYVRYLLGRLCSFESVPFSDRAFKARFNPDPASGQTLEELLKAMKAAQASGAAAEPPAPLWDMRGPLG